MVDHDFFESIVDARFMLGVALRPAALPAGRTVLRRPGVLMATSTAPLDMRDTVSLTSTALARCRRQGTLSMGEFLSWIRKE